MMVSHVARNQPHARLLSDGLLGNKLRRDMQSDSHKHKVGQSPSDSILTSLWGFLSRRTFVGSRAGVCRTIVGMARPVLLLCLSTVVLYQTTYERAPYFSGGME